MKKLTLALMTALLLTQGAANAQAAAVPGPKAKLYKTYHFCIYFPIAVVCFLMDAPVMVVAHINQHFDDLMKQDADQEVQTN